MVEVAISRDNLRIEAGIEPPSAKSAMAAIEPNTAKAKRHHGRQCRLERDWDYGRARCSTRLTERIVYLTVTSPLSLLQTPTGPSVAPRPVSYDNIPSTRLPGAFMYGQGPYHQKSSFSGSCAPYAPTPPAKTSISRNAGRLLNETMPARYSSTKRRQFLGVVICHRKCYPKIGTITFFANTWVWEPSARRNIC